MKINDRFIPLIGIAFFSLGIFFVFFYGKNHQKEKSDFNMDSGFSIGIFESERWNKSGLSKVKYTFRINNEEYNAFDNTYETYSTDGSSMSRKAKKGDKFLVLYQFKEPQNAIMYFDKPIMDSTDFQRYVREFEEMRKKQNK